MTVLPSDPDPFTIDELVLFNRLARIGKAPPNFSTRKERAEWLDKHRHLVEDRPQDRQASP